jgi:hypothetical protein
MVRMRGVHKDGSFFLRLQGLEDISLLPGFEAVHAPQIHSVLHFVPRPLVAQVLTLLA